jgi:hypothetical protein
MTKEHDVYSGLGVYIYVYVYIYIYIYIYIYVYTLWEIETGAVYEITKEHDVSSFFLLFLH